ncbi:MAG TPA: glycosyltransferase [Verrucomicrobiae bacterium]|nr:glycosyltransferase [Verrucomicrobiae bacterium]
MNSDIIESSLIKSSRQPALGNGLSGADSATGPQERPSIQGKFFFTGNQKFYIRGVTYGPFRPESDGCDYHCAEVVAQDFAQMRQHGINSVRTYTAPPSWLLDLAAEYQLRVLVGLPWEQHVTFLRERRGAKAIRDRLAQAVRACAGHPAVLGYAIGNEVPSAIVRWHGHRRVERFLERLYWTAKDQDPEGLVTYVNYPSTEYLELAFLDFVAFNVYLETPEKLRAYLARLQNISTERPLVMGEVGLDSLHHGQLKQAEVLGWQVESAFAAGCAGLFLFSWTDEWHRGGHDIDGWQFGLTTRARAPKPALKRVEQVFHRVPFPAERSWPVMSVVVCSYNGSRTLRACLEGVLRLDYPNKEIIVVDDGSTDSTAQIAAEFDVRVIRIPNGGLSNARNIGWQAAKGDMVAYLDDDACPDQHWLSYLASSFLTCDFAGIGGPNLCWPDDGLVAECVDHAPGNPTHVLVTDQEAEHLPGCNMAFRRSCLEAVGGFDSQFRIAGDDVDLCWRLHQRGWKLGFHPAAAVWHHRRGTLRGYWGQQVNYGKAEAMLERKWPEKYNAVGHATWSGRLYAKGLLSFLSWSQRRIYHGTWGSALFQSVYSRAPGTLSSVLMLPEWYLVIVLLAALSACALLYPPLRFALALLALSFIPPLAHALLNGARASFRTGRRGGWARLKRSIVTSCLHFIQPAARLWGRLCHGLTPWRRRGSGQLVMPLPQAIDLWCQGDWQSAEQRLKSFEDTLRARGAAVIRGGAYDRWDLEVRGGLLGTARLMLVIEEHGEGRQYVRMRLWPIAKLSVLLAALLFACFAIVAALDLEWTAWALLNVPAILLVGRTLYECASSMSAIRQVVSCSGQPHHLSSVKATRQVEPLPVESPIDTSQASLKPAPPPVT